MTPKHLPLSFSCTMQVLPAFTRVSIVVVMVMIVMMVMMIRVMPVVVVIAPAIAPVGVVVRIAPIPVPITVQVGTIAPTHIETRIIIPIEWVVAVAIYIIGVASCVVVIVIAH